MINEDQLEQLCIDWFREGGFEYVYGPYIAQDGDLPERSDYRQVVLTNRLLNALQRINPHIPLSALEEAAHSVSKPDHPSLIQNNRAFHRLLNSTGIRIPRVNWKDMAPCPVAIPDAGLAVAYTNLVSSFNHLAENNISNSKTLSSLRDSWSPKLLSGEISLTDAQSKTEAVT